MILRINCPKHKDGQHVWHRRVKRDYGIINGRAIVGYVCKCEAKQYIDLE